VLQPATLTTTRLILRPWRESDLEPFAALNADPEVMRHFVAPMTREESDRFVADRVAPHFAEHGYGLWATERRDNGEFIGFVGLMLQTFPAEFTPAVEVGWRLSRSAWGSGYATEGANASLRYAFEELGLTEVVSMTSTQNMRSMAVMERIGMSHNPADDFDHPRVPSGHPIQRHVLYRISEARWREINGGGG
jgi:RimJ/RimL family protein N-acetyltransferase